MDLYPYRFKSGPTHHLYSFGFTHTLFKLKKKLYIVQVLCASLILALSWLRSIPLGMPP